MKETPILMTGSMVRATLAGIKSQTRRTNGLEYFTQNDPDGWRCVRLVNGQAYFVYGNSPKEHIEKCPYGQPGDRLWAREKCQAEELDDGSDGVRYAADGSFAHIRAGAEEAEAWHKLFNYRGQQGAVVPSIHMPRWASRILLEINGLRVERLQDISDQDALAEGIMPHSRSGWHWHKHDPLDIRDWHQFGFKTPQLAFESLWTTINGAGSWEANPWVWVVKFRRIEA